MPAIKSGLAALIIVAGLSAQARAQVPPRSNPMGATGAYPASQSLGNLSAYYGMTPNFANYGLSGTYPSYGGYGYNAYGPGAQFGAHYAPKETAKDSTAAARPAARPETVRKPTARPAGQGSANSKGASRPRKGL